MMIRSVCRWDDVAGDVAFLLTRLGDSQGRLSLLVPPLGHHDPRLVVLWGRHEQPWVQGWCEGLFGDAPFVLTHADDQGDWQLSLAASDEATLLDLGAWVAALPAAPSAADL